MPISAYSLNEPDFKEEIRAINGLPRWKNVYFHFCQESKPNLWHIVIKTNYSCYLWAPCYASLLPKLHPLEIPAHPRQPAWAAALESHSIDATPSCRSFCNCNTSSEAVSARPTTAPNVSPATAWVCMVIPNKGALLHTITSLCTWRDGSKNWFEGEIINDSYRP